MHRRTLLAALAAAPFAPAPIAVGAATAADLRDDIRNLREVLKLHPGLYRYANPAQVEARIALLEREFLAAPDLAARYLALSRFMGTIRCGHSYCNFFNQTKSVAADLFDRPTRLPFRFSWVGGHMVVTGDPHGVGLAPGTVIDAINGRDPGAMLAALMPYARADGHNDAKRVALLEMHGGDGIEYFDVFHGLLYGAPAGGEHLLAFTLPGGRRQSKCTPALGLAARRAVMTAAAKDDDAVQWTWAMRPDGVAVLTMPGWALYNSKWDWRAWLNDRLDGLTGARGLIVDLRENEGGQDCGDVLLGRLAREPIALPPPERRVMFRRTPAALDPYLDTWDESFRTSGEGARPRGDGSFVMPPTDEDLAIRPSGKRVTVPVATLVGPVNSSATFQFALTAQTTGLARLFGRTTGGNRRGINGGRYFFVRLPASGVEFDLPVIGYFPAGNPPDAGVTPDVHVAPTAADIASGRDPAMEAAARWARSA